MIRRTGLILTNAPSMAIVSDALARGGFDLLKVVTGWGIDGGWNRERIQAAVRAAPALIVRTRSGDPSLDGFFGGDFAYVDQNRSEAEIYGWYRERQDLWVELGNEPNVYADVSEKQMYEYAYFLKATIARFRIAFPDAKLIAPAMKIDAPNAEHFMAICADAMRGADMIGLHAYEWDDFAGPIEARKGDLERAFALAGKLFGGMDWVLTEYGIDGPKLSPATKGKRYGQLLHQRKLPTNLVGAAYYHLAVDKKIQPQYHVYPQGDLAYHAARFGPA
jgi:hypothetical protein